MRFFCTPFPSRSACLCFLLFGIAPGWSGSDVTTLEAESHLFGHAAAYRDESASAERTAGFILDQNGDGGIEATLSLPAGTYQATFHLQAAPAATIHHLRIRLRAGREQRNLGQFHFPPEPVYHPFTISFVHPGGEAAFAVTGTGHSGFDGMRQTMSAEEQKSLTKLSVNSDLLLDDADGGTLEDAVDALEDEKHVRNFKVTDLRLLCDRIEIQCLKESPTVITEVVVDKIHYYPDETVNAQVHLQSATAKTATIVAEDVTELDSRREVYRGDVALTANSEQTVRFSYPLTGIEFGHSLRVSLQADGQMLHSNEAFFGVSENVYRIGIIGRDTPANMQNMTAEKAAAICAYNKSVYANYWEEFAWAPCDYSNLAPENNIFFSGQTQYPGSVTAYKEFIAEAHKVGIKGISYGKACAAGIEGFHTYQRYPDVFNNNAGGPPSEAYNIFYLERMLANEYNLHAKPIDGGWNHWASMWLRLTDDKAVDLGAEAVIESIKMFGWDGIRWDGHFVDNQLRFVNRLREAHPRFVHGYNICFANPGSKRFLPPSHAVEDFDAVAANHGLMMDESVRDWSHTNFSSGKITPFYTAICNEADYVKRVGGLPLFITFDMRSQQDLCFNVLMGIAAGQRYTYIVMPEEFSFGSLGRFLTRYSAFVWDDTKLATKPERFVTIHGAEPEQMWWTNSVWQRSLPNNRQQLLINIINRPGYDAFCNRVQPPPTPRHNLTLQVKLPANSTATLRQAVHLSPDLPLGEQTLNIRDEAGAKHITLGTLRRWSIVLLDYDNAPQPVLPITTPVKDAHAQLAKAKADKAAKEAAQRASISAPEQENIAYYQAYDRVENHDAALHTKINWPANVQLRRNKELDVHHARGPFSWLNPIESAVALAGGGAYRPSWVDLIIFKLSDNRGCMDEFPDSDDELLAQDVLVVDNIHARHLGATRRVRIAEFVRRGGGVLIFGGYTNLSMGADHNTAIADVLPVRIRQYDALVRNNSGMQLKANASSFLSNAVDWSTAAFAYSVDSSEPHADAEVLVTAGDHPAVVARKAGKGRVITVLINPHGDYDPNTLPYWQWSQWPRLLAGCIEWLGHDHEKQHIITQNKTRDTNKITPDELVLEALELEPRELVLSIREAIVNVIDRESAKTMLLIAADNVDRIDDLDLLKEVIRVTEPYFDASFAELGVTLTDASAGFIKEAGFRIIGLAGDPAHVDLLLEGLKSDNPKVARSALTGIGRVGAQRARSAVRKYYEHGQEKLLASTVLWRLKDDSMFAPALQQYAVSLQRKTRLKCGRLSLIDTLYGGVSFKLTPKARRRYTADLKRLRETEVELQADLDFFRAAVSQGLGKQHVAEAAQFLASTENPQVASLAYAIASSLEPQPAGHFRENLRNAKLPVVRLLANESQSSEQ